MHTQRAACPTGDTSMVKSSSSLHKLILFQIHIMLRADWFKIGSGSATNIAGQCFKKKVSQVGNIGADFVSSNSMQQGVVINFHLMVGQSYVLPVRQLLGAGEAKGR